MRSSRHRFLLTVSLHQLCTHSKICELSIAIVIQQNIASLDISMYLPCIMQIFQSSEHRITHSRNLVFIQRSSRHLDDILHRSGITIFQNKPQILILEIGTIRLHNIGTLALFQNSYFFFQTIDVIRRWNYLDCNISIILLVASFEYATVVSLAQLLFYFEDVFGVLVEFDNVLTKKFLKAVLNHV